VSLEPHFIRPAAFLNPVRLVSPASWVSHIPFAFWIVDVTRPQTLVELGTQSGNSYSAFAQAVQYLGIDTACYAVDTWRGDEHTGPYDEQVFADWSAFHDRHFARFSQNLRMTFDEARQQFSDGSIDLLHIDGLHTFDAVRHDFETWRTAMTRRGVMLFHDVNVRQGDFGVWRFWEELKTAYPSFTFRHGHGLGVLAVGPDRATEIDWLTSLEPGSNAFTTVQSFFAALGEAWQVRFQFDEQSARVARTEGLAAELDRADGTRSRKEVEPSLNEHAQETQSPAPVVNHDEALPRGDRAVAGLTGEVQELARRQAADVDDLARSEVARAREEEFRRVTELLYEAIRRTATLSSTLDEVRRDRAQANDESRRQAAARESAAARGAGASAALNVARRELAELRTSRTWQLAAPLRWAQWTRRELRGSGGGSDGLGAAIALWVRPRTARRAFIIGNSPWFDEAGYAARVPRLARGRLRGLRHYLRSGEAAGIPPHPLFDPIYYRSGKTGWPELHVPSPLVHFILEGQFSDRAPHVLFDAARYRRLNPDVEAGGFSPLAHYVGSGWREGRSPHSLFDPAFYLASNPDVARAKVEPLAHYLTHGWRELRAPHPLFDPAFYLATNPDVLRGGAEPLAHYLLYGAAEGRPPHPLFDTRFYLASVPGLERSSVNPLAHFLDHGAREGRRPHPHFETAWYRERHGIAGGVNPLVHFVTEGYDLGFAPNPWDLPVPELDIVRLLRADRRWLARSAS